MTKIKVFILLIIIIAIVVMGMTTFYLTKKISNNKAVRIEISALPYKTEYLINEELDITGLMVRLYKKNGDSVLLSNESLTITGFDSSAPKNAVEVIVKYKDFTTSFTVKVKEPPQIRVFIKKIEIIPPTNTTIKINEQLTQSSLSGGKIKRIYTNDSYDTIQLLFTHIKHYDTSHLGPSEVIVEYYDPEQMKTFQATFIINVVENEEGE